MKCKSCGAEVTNGKFCQFCGSQISYDMLREQEQMNKQGCPKCSSTNIEFKRENQGEIRGKQSKIVIHKTVGFCKDCGFTWYPSEEEVVPNKKVEPKKNNMVWWVLGWIFFFPAPIMVLIWRKKNTWDIKVKIVVTVIFWLVFFIFGLTGNSDDGTEESTSSSIQSIEQFIENSNNHSFVSEDKEELTHPIKTDLEELNSIQIIITSLSYTTTRENKCFYIKANTLVNRI